MQDDKTYRTVVNRTYRSGVALARVLCLTDDPVVAEKLHYALREMDMAVTECARCPFRSEDERLDLGRLAEH